MRTLRNAFLTLGILLASSLLAQQQYFVNISGHHTPCDPSIQNSYVYIESLPGVIPQIQIDVPVNENCYYSVTLEVNSAEYGFLIWSACANGITAVVGDSAWNVPPGITIAVVQDFDCSIAPPDCNACFTTAQAVDGNGTTIPFSATLTSCTTGGTGPFDHLWDLSWAGAVQTTQPTVEFPGPGEYIACLNVTDVNGTTCNVCETIVVDADGNVNPSVDCLGVPNGSALPGTPCSTPMNGMGTWDANCQCIPNTVQCMACINMTQTSTGGTITPFSGEFTSCSTGGAEPYTYLWDFSNAGSQTGAAVTQTFPGPGAYVVCLTMSTSDGCTSTACDSVFVDGDGNISNTTNSPLDCLGIPNGPNMPGTACNEPVTGVLGTWSANCECLPNVGLPCEAGFWVMQAYTNGDSLNNPNGGGAVPIPFELWVWNLSTGGTGNYQFVWDFGDGTSSTEAFPTHVYPASGPYTLCLTVTDGAGCEDTYCEDIEVDQDGILGMGTGFDVRSVLTIRVIQELPTGIDEGAALEATKLWPNPVAEQFDLTLNSSRSGNITLTIVDLNGREVRTTNVSVLAGNNQLPMDVSGLEAGMYVLRLTNGSNSAAMRFVKQ